MGAGLAVGWAADDSLDVVGDQERMWFLRMQQAKSRLMVLPDARHGGRASCLCLAPLHAREHRSCCAHCRVQQHE